MDGKVFCRKLSEIAKSQKLLFLTTNRPCRGGFLLPFLTKSYDTRFQDNLQVFFTYFYGKSQKPLAFRRKVFYNLFNINIFLNLDNLFYL